MKKFKDFLYDKNDILIALLILIVAALIITWRMNAIMEYPSTILNSSVSGEDQSSGDGGQSGEVAAQMVTAAQPMAAAPTMVLLPQGPGTLPAVTKAAAPEQRPSGQTEL